MLTRESFLTSILSPFKLKMNMHDEISLDDAARSTLIRDVATSSQNFTIQMLQKLVYDAAIASQTKYCQMNGTIIGGCLLQHLEGLQSNLTSDAFISSLLMDTRQLPTYITRDDRITELLESIKASHTSSISGLVIHGPSGSGKTTLAQYIACTCRSTHKTIQVSCAELVHKVVGESERRIVEIFDAARLMAPCFVILDNLDTVIGIAPPDTNDGDGGGQEAGYYSRRTAHRAIDRLLSCLLVEIDGVASHSAAGVTVIATASDMRLLDRSRYSITAKYLHK